MLAAEYETLPEPMRRAVIRFFDENRAWLAHVLREGLQDKTLGFPDPRTTAVLGYRGRKLMLDIYKHTAWKLQSSHGICWGCAQGISADRSRPRRGSGSSGGKVSQRYAAPGRAWELGPPADVCRRRTWRRSGGGPDGTTNRRAPAAAAALERLSGAALCCQGRGARPMACEPTGKAIGTGLTHMRRWSSNSKPALTIAVGVSRAVWQPPNARGQKTRAISR